MNIETVNALFNNGTFSEMYRSGFITDKIFTYREIYLWVNIQINTRGVTKNKAVLEAEVKFGKDERTIWRALNSFSGTDTALSPNEPIK
ncbi:hypothetical protein LLH06_06155 [Mucilaginibacter daejeonensis]|uniref:hypothetical protein n=1 Tax=Mucilaginibacter daejeonensis TaxID=398049 RepID=UPI001D170D60|nr:hypothetical protein [Mucilaginibacter daejeonensis]UEG54542.1 hypothetical protein LLH06_06155 [Mucilaginibacter daejeonensis]